MCQYTLFDVVGVEIHEYKRSKQCQRCWRYSTDFNALNAMYVKDIEDGVCSFYATLHTEYCYSFYSCQRCQRYYELYIQWPLAPARRESYFLQYNIWKVFSNSPPVSLRNALLTFLDLPNYKGDCRQDAQPIPNS